jgi:tRNA A-37 threonylcarbamoyl transferase component Bud32
MSMHVLLGLADQLLSRVEFIHNRKVIHGNLTPWSFVLGVGWQSQQLLLTDFNIEEQPKTISDDLRAIHKILAYLHSSAQDWESFNPDLVSVPVLDLFCRAIAS